MVSNLFCEFVDRSTGSCIMSFKVYVGVILSSIVGLILCDGDLIVKLKRYQNGTCGGWDYVKNTCYYTVTLQINNKIYRGYDKVDHTQHFELSDDGHTFVDHTRRDIPFENMTNLGSLPNPFPIKVIDSKVTMAITVVNKLDQTIFNQSYLFDTDLLNPEEDPITNTDLYRSGYFTFSYGLNCSSNFQGMGCLSCVANYTEPRCDVTTPPDPCPEHFYNHPDCDRYCNGTADSSLHGHYNCTDQGVLECSVGWGGDQCDTCSDNWYGEHCQDYCNTTSTQYACSPVGEIICKGNWAGRKNGCMKCAKSYFGPDCQVYCENSRQKVKHWKCDRETGQKICKENRAGEWCDRCREGAIPVYLYGNLEKCTACTETEQHTCDTNGTKACKKHWYGSGCDVRCEPTDKYGCSRQGNKFCKKHFRNPDRDCENCSPDYYGENCNKYCSVPSPMTSFCNVSGEIKCKENYYKPPNCKTFCKETENINTCTEFGELVCIGKRNVTLDCKECLTGWYGPQCNVPCVPTNTHFICNNNGKMTCSRGWAGAQCDRCDTHWFGEFCEDDGDGLTRCHLFCDTYCEDMTGTTYKCNKQGILETDQEFNDDLLYGLVIFGAVMSVLVPWGISVLFLLYVWGPKYWPEVKVNSVVKVK